VVRTLSRWVLAATLAVITGLGPAAYAADQPTSGVAESAPADCPAPDFLRPTPWSECLPLVPPHFLWALTPLRCPPYCYQPPHPD
jgi:hypothetical protein